MDIGALKQTLNEAGAELSEVFDIFNFPPQQRVRVLEKDYQQILHLILTNEKVYGLLRECFMNLTQEQLSHSVFYPACGYDLHPVVHFSHLTDTFIYCDWKVHPMDFVRKIKESAEALNDDLIITEIDEMFVPPFDDDRLPSGFSFSEEELTKKHSEQWFDKAFAKKVIFEKNGGDSKQVNLYYFCNVEGLCVYSNLFQSGRIAPRILVTANSGSGLGGGFAKFEAPGGVTKRFLDCCPAHPLMWVRGGKGKIESPVEGFYDVPVREFENWFDYQVQAFCMNGDNEKAQVLLQ